jgi:hypothetical protein
MVWVYSAARWARRLAQQSPILQEAERAGRLKIVAARYDLDVGRVEWLEDSWGRTLADRRLLPTVLAQRWLAASPRAPSFGQRGRLRALARHPGNRDILLMLALFVRDAGALANTRSYAQQAPAVDPDDRETLQLLQSLMRQKWSCRNRQTWALSAARPWPERCFLVAEPATGKLGAERPGGSVFPGMAIGFVPGQLRRL